MRELVSRRFQSPCQVKMHVNVNALNIRLGRHFGAYALLHLSTYNGTFTVIANCK